MYVLFLQMFDTFPTDGCNQKIVQGILCFLEVIYTISCIRHILKFPLGGQGMTYIETQKCLGFVLFLAAGMVLTTSLDRR